MYVPISVVVGILSFLAGAGTVFGWGLWVNRRQQMRERRIREAMDRIEIGEAARCDGGTTGTFIMYKCGNCHRQAYIRLPSEGTMDWQCPSCKWWVTFLPDGTTTEEYVKNEPLDEN